MTIAVQDSTVTAIRQMVRRITASTETMLPTSVLDQYINTAYTQEFPYAIKLDQMVQDYSFLTSPYRSLYPLDMQTYQGVRGDVYVNGRKAFFFKDQDQFYNMWPRLPTKYTPATGNGTKVDFTFDIGSDSPFLPLSVVIGAIDTAGNTIKIQDDGGRDTNVGNLLLITTDSTGNPVPTTPSTSPIPPVSPLPSNAIGTVDYVTGEFDFTVPVAVASGTPISVFVSLYEPGFPYSVLFWKNQFTVMPVPNDVYKVTMKIYQSPTQFFEYNEDPELKQWFQYVALLSSKYVLRDRNDFEGLAQLEPIIKQQEGLVLERQSIEEIGSRNCSIYASTTPGWGANNNWGYNGWL